jgi:hypothetical protein
LVIVFFLVRSFPLENGFSDMLLTLQAAGRSFLHGRSPYAPQLIPGPYWQRCCYWPGLWLSFLPAVVLNVDPRFLGAIYMVAFALMVWRGTGTQNRLLESWFLALYLLNPWALLRHDVYLPAYLFSWGGFFLALRQGRELAAARWFGWGLSMHPFSWALLPVWLAWVAKRQSLRTAWRNLLQALLIAAVVILPFLAWDPQGFFQGAVLYWVGKRAVAISHFGLVSWLYPWPGLLTALSLAFIGAGTWAAWKGTGSLDSLFRWLTITLGLALLASYHIEHYYYFVPLMLLLFHEIVLLEGENSIDQRFGSIRRVTQDT